MSEAEWNPEQLRRNLIACLQYIEQQAGQSPTIPDRCERALLAHLREKNIRPLVLLRALRGERHVDVTHLE